MGKFSPKPANRDRGVMLKPPIKRILLFLSSFALSVLLTTCGLEEYYYLPQVPEINIETQFNTHAAINLPPINGYYYAQSYKIFYRIYISDFLTSSNETSLYGNINSTLSSNFSYIFPNTDPTSTTSGTAANTLFNYCNYYELFIKNNNKGDNVDSLLSTSGGNLSISFSTETGSYPKLTINNTDYRLLRSEAFFTPNTNLDDKRYFRNIPGINVKDNADVVPRTDLSTQTQAYVSMYIVAFGTHPTNFTPIYSKPTHICVFKLPNIN